MSTPLTAEAIEDALRGLPAWRLSGDALERTFVFADFSEALAFIVRVGVEAERLGHHPEIRNVWSRVSLRLTTHDAGDRVTALDVGLARAIDGLTR